MKAEPEVALAARAELGEGPTWDDDKKRLLWVDILAREVHAFDPSTKRDEVILRTEQDAGAAKPCTGGGLVTNLRDGVALHDPNGNFHWLVHSPKDGCRGNDAAVGPDGAFWFGTMRYDEREGGGQLRRVHPDGQLTTVLDNVTISNGIGWSPDHRLMYYIDTPTGRVDVFDTDPNTHNRRPFAHVAEPGSPDGLTVDADGCVWVAVWGGGRVQRHTPDGKLDRVIKVPATQTTACAFGGPGLRDLYITTAATGLQPGTPHAGSLFVVPQAGQGLPDRRFVPHTPLGRVIT